MTTLGMPLHRGATETARPLVRLPGDGRRIWFTGGELTIKASAEETDGALGLLECVFPSGHAPSLLVNNDEDVAYYVLEGTIQVAHGGDVTRLGAGGFAFLPRRTANTFRVEAPGPARILLFALPGGFESFFADGGRPAEAPGLPPPGPVDRSHLGALRERYRLEIVGPSIPPP
jgi:mannose-6-phosphate isomerase-like protein (cupin superfamily)